MYSISEDLFSACVIGLLAEAHDTAVLILGHTFLPILLVHNICVSCPSTPFRIDHALHARFWSRNTIPATSLRERTDRSGDSRKRRRIARVTRPFSLVQEAR